MSTSQFTGRRAICAIGAAVAVIGAPAVAAFVGTPAVSTPRVLAGCMSSLEPGNAELDCEPAAIGEQSGAPSEMQLTESNEGSLSAESPVRGDR